MSHLEMRINSVEAFKKHDHCQHEFDNEDEDEDREDLFDEQKEHEGHEEEDEVEEESQGEEEDDDDDLYCKPLEDDDDEYEIEQPVQQQQQQLTQQPHEQVQQEKVGRVNESFLNWEQVKKLHNLLNSSMPIHGEGGFPTLDVTLRDFIKNLNRKLKSNSVPVKSIRINGGAANYVLTSMTDHQYSDIDIIFYCTLIDEKVNNFDKIKQCVFDCLLDYFPSQTKKDKISPMHLREAYVMKMVKVADIDVWSLISLRNKVGQHIELKFVDKIRRQFQFSVDSFQIHINSLLDCYDFTDSVKEAIVAANESVSLTTTNKLNSTSCGINQNFYPKVIAESLYGNFNDAKFHLDNKLIATISPEEIRGGGLLKYCNLIVRGYVPADEALMKNQEKYMCSRFFIDFNDIESQKYMLFTYLETHFKTDIYLRSNYLIQLFEIVSKSTVCLMNHERRLTLELISQLADLCQPHVIWQQQPHQQQQQHYYYNQNQYHHNGKSRYSSVSSTSSNSSTTSSTSSNHNNNQKRRYNNNNNNRQYNNNRNNYNNNYYYHNHTGPANQNYVYFNDFNAYYNHPNTNAIPQTFTIQNHFYISDSPAAPIMITRPTTLLTMNDATTPSSSSTTTNTSQLHSTNSSIVSTPLISPSESPSPVSSSSSSSSSAVLNASPIPSPVPTSKQAINKNVNTKACILTANKSGDIYYYTNKSNNKCKQMCTSN